MTGKSFLVWAFMVLLPESVNANCNTIESVAWMLGDWYSDDGKVIVKETWIQVSKQTLEGHGTTEFINEDKLADIESLRLVQMSGELFYLAKVAGNDMPVPFKLVACDENSSVFKNPVHDFPKSLTYRRTDAKHMQVEVRGENEQGFTIEYMRHDDK